MFKGHFDVKQPISRNIITICVSACIGLGVLGMAANVVSKRTQPQPASNNPVEVAYGQTEAANTPREQVFKTPVTQQMRDAVAQRYYQCVNENIRAQNEAIDADNRRFSKHISGLTNGEAIEVLRAMSQMAPNPAQAAYAQQQNFLRMKEMCRLSYSCYSDEIMSSDYDRCIRR